MNYYVVQVQTRSEKEFLELARDKLSDAELRLLWPRRELTIRKMGKKIQTLAPIFPGYIFLEAEEVPADVYWTLRRTPGFYRFLESNTNILPLPDDERKLVLHFLSFGEVIRKSQVIFDEQSRIRVVGGPMEGLEGLIVKVDKRKGRAKIRLDLYEDSFLVDLGFDVLSTGQTA
jgi:transcriptional antiterminator NusG